MYTAAYTWAEEGYPIAEVTTRMRVGSISKVFTALGVLRLTELFPEKLPQGLSTPFTTILSPALPAGTVSDPDLSKRTLDQLLAHLGKFKDDETIGKILDIATVVYPAVGEQGRALAALATGLNKWPTGDLFTSLLPSP